MPKRRIASLTCLAVSIIVCLLLTLPYSVSANTGSKWELTAQKGDWASYKIDQFDSSGINMHSMLKEGLIIRFELTDITTMTLTDKNNDTALTYEMPIVLASVNGSAAGSYLVELRVTAAYCPTLCILTTPPFYPTGADFWGDISKYSPLIEVSDQIPTVKVLEETFYHDLTIQGNQTSDVCLQVYCRIEIDERTGVLERYENAILSQGEVYYILVMSLLETSVLSSVSTLSQSIAFSLALLIPTIVVCATLLRSMKARSARELRKRALKEERGRSIKRQSAIKVRNLSRDDLSTEREQ